MFTGGHHGERMFSLQQAGRGVGADVDAAGVHRAQSCVFPRVMAESERTGLCCHAGWIYSRACRSEGDREQQEEGRRFVCVR